MNTTPQLEDGYTTIANEIIDNLQSLYLSPNEWKILWTVVRKTYGWKKKEDRISISQFQTATRLSRPNAHRAIRSLVAKSILVAKQSTAGTIYSFNKRYSDWKSEPSSKYRGVVAKLTQDGSQTDTGVVAKQSTKLVAKQSNTKEKKTTITKTTIQKKIALYSKIDDLLESDLEEIANRYKVPMAFVLSKKEDMFLWANEKAGRGKDRNWKLTLMNWVKRDALQVVEKYHDKKRYTDKYKVTKAY